MSSSLPPPPRSSSGGYIAISAVMLVAIAGLLVWKFNRAEPEPTLADDHAPAVEPAPLLDAAPPPPPPEEEDTEPPPEQQAENAPTKGGPVGCAGACLGTLSAAGESAVRTKGGQARGCYNRALRQDGTLTGKMRLAVRIGPTGNVCSVQMSEDTLGEPAVSSCVSQMFRSGKFPPPTGGCVDVNVPLNFVAPP